MLFVLILSKLFSNKAGFIARSELAEIHWNRMFLENREILRTKKVNSKAKGDLVEVKYRKEPDLSWKKLIHDDSFESRMAKNLDETDMDLENDDEIDDETEIMPLDLVSVLDFEDEENENEYSIEL